MKPIAVSFVIVFQIFLYDITVVLPFVSLKLKYKDNIYWFYNISEFVIFP